MTAAARMTLRPICRHASVVTPARMWIVAQPPFGCPGSDDMDSSRRNGHGRQHWWRESDGNEINKPTRKALSGRFDDALRLDELQTKTITSTSYRF
jgi:hypothetical protein